ncbi:MAG: polysaccharide deacetylase family protein, partial [Akkermansia sp.]|nr:polysaccharide deacetylase family protein [Akkermansia sp.]
MVACQQQDQQQNMEQAVTPVVKPAPRPKPRPRPVVKPKPRVESSAESSAFPMVQNPVSLRPLGKKVSHVPMKGKYVALTFDDGPHPSLTRKAVAILDRHGAKGTFFMLGENVNRYKSLVASVAASGHELGVILLKKDRAAACAKVEHEGYTAVGVVDEIAVTVTAAYENGVDLIVRDKHILSKLYCGNASAATVLN